MLSNEIYAWAREFADGLMERKGNKSICMTHFNTPCMEEYLKENNCSMYNGASKVCFVFKDKDWVIKATDTECFIDPNENYGHLEVINYNKALKEGLDRFFARTYEIGWIDDVYFYVQEKIDIDESENSSKFYSYVSSNFNRGDFQTNEDYEDEICYAVDDLGDEERMLALFGEESLIDELINFIAVNNINDLHEGNFGYSFARKDLVLMDFSGF